MPLTHAIAAFLKGVTPVEGHERWLGRKTMAHAKRDRGRGPSPEAVTLALYRGPIHQGGDPHGGCPLLRESAREEGPLSH